MEQRTDSLSVLCVLLSDHDTFAVLPTHRIATVGGSLAHCILSRDF